VSFYEFVILSIKIVATGGRKVNRRKPVKCKEKRGLIGHGRIAGFE
jgi:hypothetical protein